MANPIGTILSAAMLLRLSLGRPTRPTAIEAAVARAHRRRLAHGRPGRSGRRSATGSSSSAPPAFATAVVEALAAPARGHGMTDQPVVLYDTTLRDGTQGENITLSLADKLRVARMLDEFGMPFIEGGWPGSNPKDIEFFAAARTMRWEHAKLAAFGSTRHRSNKPGDDPNLPRARRRRDAGRHDLRQDLAAARDRGPRRHARPRTWT